MGPIRACIRNLPVLFDCHVYCGGGDKARAIRRSEWANPFPVHACTEASAKTANSTKKVLVCHCGGHQECHTAEIMDACHRQDNVDPFLRFYDMTTSERKRPLGTKVPDPPTRRLMGRWHLQQGSKRDEPQYHRLSALSVHKDLSRATRRATRDRAA